MTRALVWVLACGAASCQGAGGESPGPEEAREATASAEAVAPQTWGTLEAVEGAGKVEWCEADCAAVRPGRDVALGGAVATDAQARAGLRLGDGSRVWLDAQSKLQVVERGVLRFEAGQLMVEATEALAVETPAGRATMAPGASLSLRATRATTGAFRTRISVLSGGAELTSGSTTRRLEAGESAIAEDGAVTFHPGADLAYQTAWARQLRVEAELDEPGSRPDVPEGIGELVGRHPANKKAIAKAIEIKRLSVNATVRDRVARTEIEQVFRNTTRQTLEGVYTFPLPQGASIVRFAMEVQGQMMEGELLPRQRATQIFDRIVADYMRPKDPALLEWKGGNTFQIRIFPIFPGAEQRIILWYTQVLESDGPETRYTYPLPRTGDVAIEQFTFTADVASKTPLRDVRTPMYASSTELDTQRGAASVRFEKDNFRPRQDVVLEWESSAVAPMQVFTGSTGKAGDDPYFMMVLRPSMLAGDAAAPPSGEAASEARNVVFVVDTSYGTAPGDLKASAAAVAAYAAQLGPDDRVAVMAADQQVRPWGAGLERVSRASVQRALTFLEAQTPGGATDLESMFRAAAELVDGQTGAEIVYVGDGQATLGELKDKVLLDRIDARVGRSGAVVHAVGLGREVNVPLLSALTRRFGGVVEVFNRGEDVPKRVAMMAQATQRASLRQGILAFSSDKIDRVYPTHVPTLRQGEELVVVGRFRGEVDGQVTLTGLVGETPFAQPFRVRLSQRDAAERSFVPRLWAQRHIEHLTLHGDSATSAAEIVKTSLEHTVMSRLTSFLVLESERMYAQYKVNRTRSRGYWDVNGEGRAEVAERQDQDDTSGGEEGEKSLRRQDNAKAASAPSGAAASDDALKEKRRKVAESAPRDEVVPPKPAPKPAREPADPNTATPAPVTGATASDGLSDALDAPSPDDADGDAWNARTGSVSPSADASIESNEDDGEVGALGSNNASRGRASGSDIDALLNGVGGAGGKSSAAKSGGGGMFKGDTGGARGLGGAKDSGAQDPATASGRPWGGAKKEEKAKRPRAAEARPAKKAPTRTATRKPRGRGAVGGFGGDPFGAAYVPPPPAARILSVDPAPAAPRAGAVEALEAQIAREPLRRDLRRRLLKDAVRRSDDAMALRVTTAWLERDPYNAEVHWNHALALARAGRDGEALRAFGNAIELAPSDAKLLTRWARQLTLREELELAVAVYRALVARSSAIDDVLDLLVVETLVAPQQARDRLALLRASAESKLTREQRQRADGLAQALNAPQPPRGRDLHPGDGLKLRGAGAVALNWEGSADLELSVVMPYGARISPDMPVSFRGDGARGRVMAEASQGHVVGSGAKAPREAIVLPWMGRGAYTIEVSRRGPITEPVSGTVTVRAKGVRRTFQARLPAGVRTVRVARVVVQR